MRLTLGKFGVARATCVVVCLAFACGFGTAQELVSANEPGGDGAVNLTLPTTDESAPHDAQATQTPGSGGVSTADPASQGNAFKRFGKFYAADWTGKLTGSATPERRALDAPLESPPFPSSDWDMVDLHPLGFPMEMFIRS
jgi:hypothetical protein